MIDDPLIYRWSSATAHAGQRTHPLLTDHATYIALGATEIERGSAYQALLRGGVPDEDLLAICVYLQQQRAWGRDSFKSMVEAKTRRFASIRPAYRPPRVK